MAKLDSELRALAAKGGTEPVLVYILAEAGTDLSGVADVTETRPFLGQELVVANVKPDMIAKMASHPGVVSAEVFHPVEAPIPLTPGEGRAKLTREQVRELREQAAELKASGAYEGSALTAAPAGATSPQDWNGVDLIGAPAAWAKGFTGDGVNVAVLDSGVDFGHPDLEGSQATYDGGPYDGWPIALDPRSMRNYYYNGLMGWDNYDDWWDYSWYADVYDVIYCTQGVTATFDFNGYEFSIAPDIVAMSKSNEIRWSVHPDEQLADFVWDWVPFILLDTTTAGVYDTVIADLNFDLWFDKYDDVANKADPVLSQDLGAYLDEPTEVISGTMYVPDTWGEAGMPPTWWDVPQDDGYGPTTSVTETLPAGTWIWAPNHWTPDGTTTLEDGIADVSGGMVYYIADGANPIPGMDYLYPGIGPAGSSPIPLNGQLVAFMIGSLWAGGGEHGTLVASAIAAGGVISDVQAATGEMVQFTADVFPTKPLQVGIVGAYAGTLYNHITNDGYWAGRTSDDYLMQGDYEFTYVGNNWMTDTIRGYDMLLVDESDNGLTEDEAGALVAYFDAGNPIVMGMSGLDDASKPIQDAVQYIFGVTNARDATFSFDTITDTFGVPANHPIAQGLTWADTGGGNNYFELYGADWVVRDDADGDSVYDEYFVVAKESSARTVLMGERLYQWYAYSDLSDYDDMPQPLVRNAIEWAAAGLEDMGTRLFFDDFSLGTGLWTLDPLWHSDPMTDTWDPITPVHVFSPTVSFNHDETGTYTGTAAVEGSLTLASPLTLPEADSIELLFRSYEEVETVERGYTITSSQQMTVAVAGGISGFAVSLNGDPNLSTYNFIDVGDNFTFTRPITYDALVVSEWDSGLTITETQQMKAFYDAGKPVILGMDDLDDQDAAIQGVINGIFGVDKARDNTFNFGTISEHPIGQLVNTLGSLGSDNDYFLEDGAEWVVQGTDDNYYVLAYEGTANTVIFGERLNYWYGAGHDGDQLVSNAIIWAIEEGIPDPPELDANEFDVRYVEISTDGGTTWEALYDSSEDFMLEGAWYQQSHDLTYYAGEDVLIRFRFDSVDAMYNEFVGWYVDNVTIKADDIWEDERVFLTDEGIVQGPAPGAKIIAIGDNYQPVNGMQGFYDAYTFLAYGVDGLPNSGDEFVDIASMSYGDGSVHNDGWDWESRLISYYNQQYLPNTTFFASSGNGGWGFGTINSPQGNTIVSVGASTQYGATDVFGGGLALGQINDGEIQPFSGRGPDAMGRPDPDVVATGAWAAGDVPVNLTYGYGGASYPDGGNAWFEWGGTSRSAPEAAGVMALVYEAYEDANGSFPDFETARQILMSGADDLSHDVLMQGAGRVNADRATDVAGGTDGVFVSPSLLAAGEYKGSHYESFANLLFPGDTWSQEFTVYNEGASAASLTLGDEVLMQLDVVTFTQIVTPYLGIEDSSYPNNYYFYADYFVGADPTITTHGSDLVITPPAGADFMQVQLLVPFEVFDFSYDDPNPWSVSYSQDQRWSLTVYDWTDRNGDGKLWEDTSEDGVVNFDAFDEVDIAYSGVVTQTELNRFAYGYNYANEQEVTVRLADRTDIDNIVIGIVHRNPNDYRGMGSMEETEEFYQDNPLLIKVVFYEKTGWGLVSESATTLSVPAGGSATFDADFTIPADQDPGLYEGAITVDDGTHKTIIPTTVNVAVPGDELLFTLGGNDPAGTPYDNGRMTGGYNWYSVYEEGDWRFYYYDADAGFDQQYLYVRNQWGELCGNMPTANETLVWGPNPGDQYSLLEPDKYGPYGLQFAGGTSGANGPQYGWGYPRRGSWWTNGDGTPLPETRSWATLWDGLNQVQFRNILLSGKSGCGEGFEATAGVFGVDAPETGLVIDSADLSGSFTLDAVSPVDGLRVYARGFNQGEIFRNQDVPQGRHFDSWPADLMDGWVHTFEVTNITDIEVWTVGPGSSDIDLYLLYDANGDGIFNPYSNVEALAYGFTVGPEEYIWYDGNFDSGGYVQDGTYAVVMYGYNVEPGDQFDLHLMTYGGDDLNVDGATPDNNYLLSVTPGVTESLTVNWEVPESGMWYGYLWVGMPWEEEAQYWSMGPGFYIPVTINAAGTDFSRSTKEVDKETVLVSHSVDDSVVLTYTITLVNDGVVDQWVEVYDLLPEGVTYYEQYIDDWDDPDHGDSYVAKWWYENGKHGYFWPDSDDYIRRDFWVGPSRSGRVYIQYQVKVKPGFTGTITNKADIKVWSTAEFLSLTATTNVLHSVFMPLTIK